MNDDTAADLQMAYDWAVHEYGPESEQAKEAEKAALEFFKDKRVDGPRLVSTPSPVALT